LRARRRSHQELAAGQRPKQLGAFYRGDVR